ncbi:MAG: hypothetical protein WKF86_00940, partial [Acidimicrobiales bacterium]
GAVELSGEGNLEVGPHGGLFVVDARSGTVLHLDGRGEVTRVLGGAAAAEGCCQAPLDVAATASGDLYVSDGVANRVWFVNRSTAPVTAHGQLIPPGEALPVAGRGGQGFSGDGGPAVDAQFLAVRGVALGPEGSLYVADADEHTVRRIDPAGTIHTAAGSGRPGFNGDALKGPATTLNTPTDVTLDRCGNLLVVDSLNSRLRRVSTSSDPSCQPLPDVPTTRPDSGRRGVVLGVVAGFGVLGAAGAGLVVGRRRRAALRRGRGGASPRRRPSRRTGRRSPGRAE